MNAETSNEVVWERTLRVKVKAVIGGERMDGFARITKQGDSITISSQGAEFTFSPEVIEAIYDLHQEIPR